MSDLTNMHPVVAHAVEKALGAPASYARVVATDADGTLWEGDIGDALFLHLCAHDSFSPQARGLISRTAQSQGLAPDTPVRTLVEQLMTAYYDGRISIETMCSLQARTAGGRSVQDFHEIIERVCVSMLPRLRPFILPLFALLKTHAMPVHVVTGSLGTVVSRMLVLAGVSVASVSGVALMIENDTVLIDERVKAPLHEGKVMALRAQQAFPAALGMGDGGWDVAFLRDAHVPLLIAPQPALRDAMREHPRALVWLPD